VNFICVVPWYFGRAPVHVLVLYRLRVPHRYLCFLGDKFYSVCNKLHDITLQALVMQFAFKLKKSVTAYGRRFLRCSTRSVLELPSIVWHGQKSESVRWNRSWTNHVLIWCKDEIGICKCALFL